MGIWMGVGMGMAPIIIHLIIIHPRIIHLILTDIRSGLRRRFMFSARILNPLPRHRATGITAVTLRVIILPSRNVLKGGSRLFPSHPTNRFLIPTKMRRLFALLALCSLSACVSIPTGPSVLVLPGSGRALMNFAATTCVAGSTPPNRWARGVSRNPLRSFNNATIQPICSACMSGVIAFRLAVRPCIPRQAGAAKGRASRLRRLLDLGV